MGRTVWRLGGALVLALAAGAAVAWLTVPPSADAPPVVAVREGRDAVPPVSSPTEGDGAAVPPPVAAPQAPAEPPRPLPEVDRVLHEHAQEAAPRWSRAAEILVHSPHPELAELAGAMAARLDAAAVAGLDAAHRQELVNEERQLLHFLRQRYAGYEPLERPLERIDASLQELEATAAEPVASPDPRERRPVP